MTIQQISGHNDSSIRYTNNDSRIVKEDAAPANTDTAAVYETTSAPKKVYQRDQATIDRLLSEAEAGAKRREIWLKECCLSRENLRKCIRYL